MSLPELCAASRRENPLCYWLRNILGIAAAFMALFTLINLTNGAMPARSELTELSGTYVRMERESGSEDLCLYVESDSGLTERYRLSGALGLDTASLSRTLTPGKAVTLRYQNDEYRDVYELTAGDVPLLTYARAAAADRENRYWGYGLVAALTAAALTALAGWALWERRRRRQAQSARAAEETARPAPPQPALYDPEERAAVEAYIRDAFGPISRIFHEPPADDIQVDVAVVAPTREADFYKLVTVGMGARRMNVPDELVDRNRAYAEVCVFLPPDWQLLGDDEADTWPFAWLKRVARMPGNACEWVGAGHVFSTPLPGCDFAALLLTWAVVRPEISNRLLLGGGKLINFYQLTPIFQSELDYQRQRGSQRLWDRMAARGLSPVVDPRRESLCPDGWFDAEISPLVWSEGEGEFYLGMDVDGETREAFRTARCPTDGFGWEKLARAFLSRYMPDWSSDLTFRCRESVFFAAADDADFLRAFALQFHDFCEVPERVRALLAADMDGEKGERRG